MLEDNTQVRERIKRLKTVGDRLKAIFNERLKKGFQAPSFPAFKEKFTQFQSAPLEVLKQAQRLPLRKKIYIGTAIAVVPLLLLTQCNFNNSRIEEPGLPLPPPPTKDPAADKELKALELEEKKLVYICDLATASYLTFKNNGQAIRAKLKKEANVLATGNPTLKQKLYDYGLYCATVAY
jgi:hypothetical protein